MSPDMVLRLAQGRIIDALISKRTANHRIYLSSFQAPVPPPFQFGD
jgi:hypothetical protein